MDLVQRLPAGSLSQCVDRIWARGQAWRGSGLPESGTLRRPREKSVEHDGDDDDGNDDEDDDMRNSFGI